MTLFPVLVVAVVFGFLGAGGWPGTDRFLHILLAGALMVVANGVSNAVGSVGDMTEDTLHPTKQDRPVPGGFLSPINVLSLGVTAWLVALVVSALVLTPVFTALYGTIIVFAFSYSFYPRLKDRLFWNNAWLATPRGALGIAAMWSLYGSVSSPELWTVVIVMVPMVFFGNEARNINDRLTDLAAGVRNITTVFGEKTGRTVSYLGFLVPVLLVLLLGFYRADPFLLLLIVPAVVMLWGSFRWNGETVWLAFYGVFGLSALLFATPLLLSHL